MRSVFVIGSDMKVRLTITYPASTGSNLDEILRVIESLQLTSSYKVATPVNWQYGDDVIIFPAGPTPKPTRRPKGLPQAKARHPRAIALPGTWPPGLCRKMAARERRSAALPVIDVMCAATGASRSSESQVDDRFRCQPVAWETCRYAVRILSSR